MTKRIAATFLIAFILNLPSYSFAGELLIENKSAHKIKVASIGGGGTLASNTTKTINFENEERGADINIWWVKNVRELCQIFTPWDRTVTITGKHTINCLSRN
ncbi:exported hypothetical protein [Candidatus Terasakiella magnetica]|uniref:Uncharacterized protein n=1 Tax=Candidatus Terasakiella magnetica TaxID=1867952 RepID=A0A1C3RKY8_9PROT|nr:hypothetical protein [Candidatus Terasakiella magnetica]SCA57992.1 exported hypothetical protein [Candidatus Terasakiella magnetica]